MPMIEEFTRRYFEKLPELRASFESSHPEDYKDLVKRVVGILTTDNYGAIDPERIHQIDDGDCQGTLVFVIASKGYQPSDYWYCRISYGSCSGCDTLESIRSCGLHDAPSEREVSEYMQLACHVVQNLRKMGGDQEE